MNIFTAVKYCCMLHGRVGVIVRARALDGKAIIIDVSFVVVFNHNNITVDPDETDHNDSTCVIFLL